ncbi:hypothetical protein [Paracoccus sp. (in: a-proteobacteria)]|uniref:hypothetical protein n=1 Tax=Paracoccus sp. TaxID=267 RepID=UPI0026E01FFF|nr:hypothetical protein [Paracoccus sp. (in: a-proteobacteria)]MDO5647120.1 hypothetical protein [Paracoccus sp. (in: a-proteobacteria)]
MFVIQYWPDGAPPPDIRDRQNGWRAAFGARHILFDADHARHFLTRHFGADTAALFDDCAVPAMASDFFRYHAVAVLGGLYVDSELMLGDVARLRRVLDVTGPLTAAVPAVDQTPDIATARQHLGRVLLNNVLFAPADAPYVQTLAALVRELVRLRADTQIPYVTGIGVLSALDYAIRQPDDPIPTLRAALPRDKARFLNILTRFITDHDLRALTPAVAVDFRDLAGVIDRPAHDDARLTDPAHWSNHRGSIFTT